MKLRGATAADRTGWLRLRRTLWPDRSAVQHALEMDAIVQAPAEHCVIVVDRGDGRLGGFVEVSIRTHPEERAGGRVANLDGWYVEYELREQGWGRRLVAAAEAWAQGQGISELAGTADIHDEAAIAVYQKLGFRETGRLAHFRKAVGSRPPASVWASD